MDYLSYMDKKDKNRRRKKNYAIYALYLLIPVFLFASTFTNERIITKCEDIYHEKIVYEQEVIEKETIINKCSHRVDSLSRLLGINTIDYKIVTEKKKEVEASNSTLKDRIRLLEKALADAEAALTEKDKSLKNSAELIGQLRGDNAAKDERIKRLNASVQEQEAKIAELESQLWICEKDRDQAVREKESCEDRYKTVREERDALKRANEQLTKSRDSYKSMYEAEQRKNANLQARYDKLKGEYDRCASNLSQMKQATPTVTIEPVSSVPGNNFMLIKRNQRYKVVVNGRIMQYIGAQWVD